MAVRFLPATPCKAGNSMLFVVRDSGPQADFLSLYAGLVTVDGSFWLLRNLAEQGIGSGSAKGGVIKRLRHATDPDVFAKFFDVFAKFFEVSVENGAQFFFEI